MSLPASDDFLPVNAVTPYADIAPDPASGWAASLHLDFQVDARDQTVLRRREHSGPLRIQRTFHPEGAVCHAYLLHPPGGVVGGDRLDIQVTVGAGAQALITTPAAGKFYRSAGARASQTQTIDVAPGGCCEWLPGMNILHGGARVDMRQRFRVAASSRLLAWDVVGLGRPGSGDGFSDGDADISSRFELFGVPEWIDRWRVRGGSAMTTQPWGMQRHDYSGTLLAWPATSADLEELRAQQPTGGAVVFSGTLLPVQASLVGSFPGESRSTEPRSTEPQSTEPRSAVSRSAESRSVGSAAGLLVGRWLASDGEALGWRMREAWSQLRPRVVGLPACPPRVWST
jgi:urease accessory protein